MTVGFIVQDSKVIRISIPVCCKHFNLIKILLVAAFGAGVIPQAFSQLSNTEITTLQYMREEERLAHDAYLSLYEIWGTPIFATIAQSELSHTNAVLNQINRYSLADPALGLMPGEFAFSELQTLYDTLLASGQQSELAALQVGITIETTDITDLQQALAITTSSSIEQVYTNLLKGSTNHLQAFTTNLEALGGIPSGNGNAELPGIAIYDPISHSLYIPAIDVTSLDGTVKVYDALLSLVETVPQTLSLLGASVTDKQPSSLHASFDLETGLVLIPEMAVGTLNVSSLDDTRYAVSLKMFPDSGTQKLFTVTLLSPLPAP